MTDQSTSTSMARSLRACLGATALLAFTALPAQAENPAGCRAKIERAEARYDAAVYRFGRDSARAYKERNNVYNIRSYCYRLFGEWWDPHGNRWHREHW